MLTDFIYDGRALSDFGYVLVFDNNEEELDISSIELNTISSARNDRSYNVGYKYSENYSRTFYITKNPCVDNEDEFLSDYDISELSRWLCRKQFNWFRYIDEDMESNDEIWYKGYFTAKKSYVGDNVWGLQLTLHTDSPYGYTRPIVGKYTSSSFAVNVNSDEEGYIYPDITIQMQESGDLTLTNTTEGRSTTLAGCVSGEVIHLFGYDIQQINSTASHDYINQFNYKFPRLWYSYGNTINNFTVNRNCIITMEYREIRKVGLK